MTRDDLVISSNPMGLVEVVQDYGVSEFGGLFIYVPHPRRNADREVWGWIEATQLASATIGGTWTVKVKKVAARLSGSHPKLFDGDPTSFEIYRLDQERLARLIR